MHASPIQKNTDSFLACTDTHRLHIASLGKAEIPIFDPKAGGPHFDASYRLGKGQLISWETLDLRMQMKLECHAQDIYLCANDLAKVVKALGIYGNRASLLIKKGDIGAAFEIIHGLDESRIRLSFLLCHEPEDDLKINFDAMYLRDALACVDTKEARSIVTFGFDPISLSRESLFTVSYTASWGFPVLAVIAPIRDNLRYYVENKTVPGRASIRG